MSRALILVSVAAMLLAAPLAADELITTDGSRLVGTFDKLEAGHVHFTDKSAGALRVAVEKVAGLTLDGEKQARIRRGAEIEHQEDVTIFTQQGALRARWRDGVTEDLSLAALRGINETVPDKSPLWTASLVGMFGLTDGNTRTYSMGFRADLRRETEFNFQGLYAEGNYLQDRNLEEDSVRRRDFAFGYFYRYIFTFRLTIDLTQDVTFNELAGYHWRSVTGFGPGYYIIREDNQSLHVGLHLTYTYEDLLNGADDRSYWGARARAEYDRVSAAKTTHVNVRSELLLDFDEFKNVGLNNTLLAETRPYEWLSAGVLVKHAWDNMPVPGFKSHDLSILFTVALSWSGRWK